MIYGTSAGVNRSVIVILWWQGPVFNTLSCLGKRDDELLEMISRYSRANRFGLSNSDMNVVTEGQRSSPKSWGGRGPST